MIMNTSKYLFIVIVLTFFTTVASAQNIGINNSGATPDASALLDVDASPGNDKGLLIPRVALVAKNNTAPITAPATSLLVYNTATSGAFPNNVIPGYYYWSGTAWIAFETKENRYSSIDTGVNTTTTTTTAIQVPGMSLSPGLGTYSVHFNAQCEIPDAFLTTGVSTADLCTDLGLIYNDINTIAVTDTHALTFGTNEILFPGVYTVLGAGSIAGSLTLDGGGNSNSLFIIKCAGAFTTGAGSVVTLTNGASPENIFWIAQTVIGIGVSTVIQGTMISNTAAVSVGATCTIDGRLFTKAGAVTFGPGTLSRPIIPSPHVNLRGLISFVMYTCNGGVGNTGASTYNGDIGTNVGAITGFAEAGCVVNGTIHNAGTTVVVTPVYHVATFGLYQNGILIPNSERTRTSLSASSDIYLQGISTVTAAQPIEVRWEVDTQVSDSGAQVGVSNRILTLIRVE
jgi:hypothetical protein